MVLDDSLQYVQCFSYSAILQICLLPERFDTVEFIRLQRPKNKMYDGVVLADRFRYQLTKFRIRLLVGLSRLLQTHIAYDIDTAKIIAAFCRISYCLHDFIRLNSIVCHAQATRWTMRWFSLMIPIRIVYIWNMYIDRDISTPWYSYCIWNSYIKNHHW